MAMPAAPAPLMTTRSSSMFFLTSFKALKSAAAVTKLVTSGCNRVHLCHLSKENNLPELAMQSVRVAMLEAGVVPDSDCVVRAAERFDISPVWFL